MFMPLLMKKHVHLCVDRQLRSDRTVLVVPDAGESESLHPSSTPFLLSDWTHVHSTVQAASFMLPSLNELAATDRPYVEADALGMVVRTNQAFREVYGWSDDEIVGQSLGTILPESFRMSHQLGFSRFQATEKSTILAHPLRLSTRCADGRDIVSEHYIVAEKRDDGWVFGATLTPLPEGTPSDA